MDEIEKRRLIVFVFNIILLCGFLYLSYWGISNNLKTLVYIGLANVFTYNSYRCDRDFRGSSLLAKSILGLAGFLGYIMYLVTLV